MHRLSRHSPLLPACILFALLISFVLISGCTFPKITFIKGALRAVNHVVTGAGESEAGERAANGGSGSYVVMATPFAAEPVHEARDLTGKSREESPVLFRKAIEDSAPVYAASFSPRYSSSAFRIHVAKGPLIIVYRTKPLQEDPRIAFLKITVSDTADNSIVAETGYGNPYPSSAENRITVNGEGEYLVNLYGNQVNVAVEVFTGDVL